MTPNRLGGARGTNQYTANGGRRRSVDRRTSDDIRRAIELEQAAWGFTVDQSDLPERVTASSAIRLAAHPEAAVRRRAAQAVNCPPDVLVVLADDPQLVAAVAANPSCPPDTLTRISRNWSDKVTTKAVVGNPSSPPEVFDNIFGVRHPTEQVTYRKARTLSQSNAWAFRGVHHAVWSAAANPSCPADHLWRFGHYSAYALIVVENPSCPPDLLDRYITRGSGKLASRALRNPNCSEQTLRSIVADKFKPGTVDVVANPSCPPDILTDAVLRRRQIGKNAANNPNLPPEAWDVAARLHPTSRAARQVASAPNSAPGTLRRLFVNGSSAVRAKIAANPSCPPDLFPDLMRTQSVQVTRALATNPNLPVRLLTMLTGHPDDRTKDLATRRLPAHT